MNLERLKGTLTESLRSSPGISRRPKTPTYHEEAPTINEEPFSLGIIIEGIYMININKKLKNISPSAQSAFWFTVCNILQKGIQFITTPIYTRLLSTDGYGYYSLFLTWCNIISIVVTLSLANTPYYNGLLKYKDKRYEYTSSIQILCMLSTVIFTMIFSCLYPLIGEIIGLPYNIAILMYVFSLVSPAFQFWTFQQRLYNKYKALLMVTIIKSLLMPAIGIFFIVYVDFGYEGAVYGYIIGNLSVDCFFVASNLIKGKKFFSKEYWTYAIRVCFPLIPHYLSQILLGQCDRIMINYYCGADFAGIYTLSYQVSLIMNLLTSGINNSLTPWIYRKLTKKDYEKIRNVSTILICLVGSLTGIVMLVAPEIIYILGGSSYMDAIWVIPPVMLSTFLIFAYGVYGNVLFYFEKSKEIALGSLSGAFFNIILNIILIPKFGYIAAAYTTIIGYMVIALIFLFFTRSECIKNGFSIKKIYNFKITLILLIVLVCISFVTLMLYNFSFMIRYIILIAIFALMFINRKKLLNEFNKINMKE